MIVSLTSPLVAIAIFVMTMRRQRTSDRIRILFEMQERYTSKACREGRRLIHTRIRDTSDGDIEKIEPGTLEEISSALAIMNTIAICVLSGYCDQRLVMQSMGRSYSSTMRAAAPLLDIGARKRGFRPYGQAEELAVRMERLLPRG